MDPSQHIPLILHLNRLVVNRNEGLIAGKSLGGKNVGVYLL